MIRTDAEYRRAMERVEAERQQIAAMRSQLAHEGLPPDQVKRAVDPLESFRLQLVEEVEAYRRLKRGEFDDLENLGGLGRLLVALRIHRGMSQRELADRLGCHESQVSRDERNEYHGVTVARAQRILGVLGVRIASRVELMDTGRLDGGGGRSGLRRGGGRRG